jgi:hypothetical protein
VGNNLTKIEQKTPVPTKSLPAIPEWATKMLDDARMSCQRDPKTGRDNDFMTLAFMPTAEQAQFLTQHADQCRAMLAECPINHPVFAKGTFGLIAKLMLAKPGRVAGPEATEARMETYQMALEDVPVWAVESAIRRWHRGECDMPSHRYDGKGGEKHDYTWAPESAILRKIALREVAVVNLRLSKIALVSKAVQRLDNDGNPVDKRTKYDTYRTFGEALDALSPNGSPGSIQDGFKALDQAMADGWKLPPPP